MLKHLASEENRTYVSMDNTMVRMLAKSAPVFIFGNKCLSKFFCN